MTIYFAQAGDDGPVKIGFAVDVAKRLRALQTGSPIRLRLVGVLDGDGAAERELHRRFTDCRVAGEWFALRPTDLATLPLRALPPTRRQPRPHEHPLRAYRRAQTLTLDAFAAKAATSAATVSRVETGALEPSFDLLRRLIDATEGQVTADDLVDAARPPRRSPQAA